MTSRAERMAAALAGRCGGGPVRGWTPSGEPGQGYEPPAVMPPDPSDVAARNYERRFVEAKRKAGVGWQNIARMLGKCEAQLRCEYGGGA